MVQKGHSTQCCKGWLNVFTSLQALRNQTKYCDLQYAVRRELAKPGTTLGFEPENPNDDYTKQIQVQLNKSMQVPVVFYADFESCVQPIDSSSSSSLLAEMRTEKQRYNTHCCQK